MRLLEFPRGVLREWQRLPIFLFAAAIAFHLLVWVVPFVLVVMSALGHVLSREEVFREAVPFILQRLPAAAGGALSEETIRRTLLGLEAGRRRAFALALLFALAAAAGLLRSMRAALNDAYRVEEPLRGVRAQARDVAFSAFLGLALITAGLLAQLPALVSELLPLLPLVPGRLGLAASQGLSAAQAPAPFVVNLGLAYLLYHRLPDRPPPRRSALASAAAFALAWEAARRAAGWYFEVSLARYDAVYGAFGFLALLGLWAYLSALLFTACAAVGQAWVSSRSPSETPR